MRVDWDKMDMSAEGSVPVALSVAIFGRAVSLIQIICFG